MLPLWDVTAKLSVGRTMFKGGKTQPHCTHNLGKSAVAKAENTSLPEEETAVQVWAVATDQTVTVA